MTHSTRSRSGFSARSIHRRMQPHAGHYLKEKMAFWIAVISLFAFATGNLVGKLGFDGFLASVRGEFDDSLIAYDGAVMPVDRVPNFLEWSLYGGNAEAHTYRQVPSHLLIPLPSYIPADLRSDNDTLRNLVYSVGFMGSYDHPRGGGKGGHAGVDIRVPPGTPVRAVMNGVVVRATEDAGGFGKYVELMHNAPDPDNPAKLIRLYTVYAHLSAVLVEKGMVVRKGEQIGLSGQTGNATGPHVHYQMQRGEQYFQSFTTADLKAAGMSYSQAINAGLNREEGLKHLIDGVAYVQAQYPATVGAIAHAAAASNSSSVRAVRRARTLSERVAVRVARLRAQPSRVTIAPVQTVTLADTTQPAPSAQVSASSAAASSAYSALSAAPPAPVATDVAHVEFRVPRTFSAAKQPVPVTLILHDAEGKVVSKPNKFQLYLRSEFGTVTCGTGKLTEANFRGGAASVTCTPSDPRTFILVAQPFGSASAAVQYVPPQ